MGNDTQRHGQASVWPGILLAAVIAVCAFVLSFDALRTLSLACGAVRPLAWMFPVVVDGSTLAFTWATWAFRTRGIATWYPWAALILFSVFSLIGNALHAHPVPVGALSVPGWVAAAVMSVPPVALLATTHMIVMAAGRSLDQRNVPPAHEPEAPPEPADVPVDEGAPEPETSEGRQDGQQEEPATPDGTSNETEQADAAVPEGGEPSLETEQAAMPDMETESAPTSYGPQPETPEPLAAPDVREAWRERLSDDDMMRIMTGEQR